MEIAARTSVSSLNECPHCKSGFVVWDKVEKEPYCCICGWRRAVHISKEQARNHFRTEQDFWINLFASKDNPHNPRR